MEKASTFCFNPPDKLEKLDNSKNRPKLDKDEIYFKCYESLALHNSMMKDRQRMGFYYQTIVQNRDLFQDKVVLDVGSGLGILSMFAAQAGAKKVYAVEASKEVSKLADEAFFANEMEDIIESRNGKIEDIVIDDKIDIIISEWMGYCLLYELMLSSVIHARDKYNPSIIIPAQASVHICGFFDKEYFEVSF